MMPAVCARSTARHTSDSARSSCCRVLVPAARWLASVLPASRFITKNGWPVLSVPSSWTGTIAG